MDILARAPVKGAAKRDSLCELQNSVNQWPPERALHSWDFLRVCLLQRLTCPNFASISALRSYELLPSLSQWLVNCLVLAKCFARCYSSFYLRGFT